MSEVRAYVPRGTVEYRRAVPSDIGAIVDLGIEALKANGYERLVISPSRVTDLARNCVSGAGNIAMVAEKDGEVVAAVCGIVHPMMCYERSQLSIVQFFTRVPGCGVPLMRAVLAWARSRPIIKSIVFTLETRADPRIGMLLKRLGLQNELPVYMSVQ